MGNNYSDYKISEFVLLTSLDLFSCTPSSGFNPLLSSQWIHCLIIQWVPDEDLLSVCIREHTLKTEYPYEFDSLLEWYP